MPAPKSTSLRAVEIADRVEAGISRDELLHLLSDAFESIEDAAWQRGKQAGESAHDGSWPND